MSDYWKCPKCGTILQKEVGRMFASGAVIVGTATCGGCGAQFNQHDVYSGKFDVAGHSHVPGRTRSLRKIRGFEKLLMFLELRTTRGWPTRLLPKNHFLKGFVLMAVGIAIAVLAIIVGWLLNGVVPQDGILRLMMIAIVLPTEIYGFWATIIGFGFFLDGKGELEVAKDESEGWF